MTTPKFPYIGTITFHGLFDPDKKKQFITNLTKVFSRFMSFSAKRSYTLEYTIEYHKADMQDDFESPHVHFILMCSTQIQQSRAQGFLQYLKQIGSRNQFYRPSQLKLAQWKEYITKDTIRYELKLGYPHHFITKLEREDTRIEESFLPDDNEQDPDN